MITERERLHSHILKLSRLVNEKDNVIMPQSNFEFGISYIFK